MFWYQPKLEGQDFKPVSFWILEFLDPQLGMLKGVCVKKREPEGQSTQHYGSWAYKAVRLDSEDHHSPPSIDW